jgi:uncharacterized protein YggL (DUF469 family)
LRKRLRKKLRRGEFTEYAFDVQYSLNTGLPAAAAEEFFDRLIEHAIEARNLCCAGGGKDLSWDFLVTKAGRGSTSEEDRTAVQAWLAQQPEVRSYAVGQFVDAWHDSGNIPGKGHAADEQEEA